MKMTTENLMIEPALGGGLQVRFSTDDIAYAPDMLHKYEGKPVTIEVKHKREGRSLDANAYCWVLCDKIAGVKGLRVKKMDVYRQAIRDYGVSSMVLLKKEAIPKFIQDWENESGRYGKFADVMGSSPSAPGYMWVKVYYGSSDYDTHEMSILIDGLVADAQDLGIDTMTPAEIEHMKNLWGA